MAAIGYVDCFKCRKLYEEDERLPPCEDKGICFYTGTTEPPPNLDGYALVAWDIWNTKEILGEDTLKIKLKKYNAKEQEILVEILKEIEILALQYELKQPKQCLGGL